MFESLIANKEDAIAILKSDHEKVKGLFEQFEKADNLREKKKIAAEAIIELKIHAEIEEKIFYPAVRKELGDEDIMNEADEEHHVAKLLIAELDQMDGSEDHWEAKFTVLSENIRHHIKEEEVEMMPKARKEDIDFNALGQKLLAAKQSLKKNGVPESDEGKLMARNANADSPAKNARKTSAKILPHKGAKKSSAVKKPPAHRPRKAS
jgi:hypothetical protein